MRWRPLIWLASALLLLAILWRSGQGVLLGTGPKQPVQVALQDAVLTPTPTVPETARASGAFPYRLSNTTQEIGALAAKSDSILLENVFLDTSRPLGIAIPAALRADGDPGAYIVQSREPLVPGFRNEIERQGGAVVSYIPNNSLLVRGGRDTAERLRRSSLVRSVVTYEPYYKLKPSLLSEVLRDISARESGSPQVEAQGDFKELNLVLFPGTGADAAAALAARKVEILAKYSSPFGPVMTVRCSRETIAPLARMEAVQLLELSHRPVPMMDLGRAAAGVAENSTSPFNRLGLSGTNVLVAVLDCGVDISHPDLAGRVWLDSPEAGNDSSGHGTHVAAIVAGNGAASPSIAAVPGSISPVVDGQFRGVAPGAALYSIRIEEAGRPVPLETCLQRAATTNASVVNGSWVYEGDYDYSIASAICDAAARDALAAVPGAQPLTCVFAAGNRGAAAADGTCGTAGTVQSPATAKNVITVGALEKSRWVTNETWSCRQTEECQTNTPWLAQTDSTNQVARFSSRGNVGIGTEGSLGRAKPDLVAQGAFVLAARSAQWDEAAYYADHHLFAEALDSNCVQVLSNLNARMGPRYRFESGTSLAAAQVSGALALMTQFLAPLGRTPSPAALKALLLNGARPVGAESFGPGSCTNSQGWGQLHLPTSIAAALTNPAATMGAMFLFDEGAAGALSTGLGMTRGIRVKPSARSSPLRITLVWTDPPANPVAGVKLVNDLDLVVTNLDTGEVFLGNDIPVGSLASRPWTPVEGSGADRINNVETVILAAPLSGRYAVGVVGSSVNVNAVGSTVASIAQDYALVVSSGDGEVPDALSLEEPGSFYTSMRSVRVLTNSFQGSPTDFGAALWCERVGAGAALLSTNSIPLRPDGGALLAPGTSNQWRFYVLTNENSFTNAAFVTFLAQQLSLSSGPASSSSGTLDGDIDLYVSQDPGLVNLDPVAIAGAQKSLSRGGAESILLSNAAPGAVYIGVKCESQSAAEYSLLAVFSDRPFSEIQAGGQVLLRGFPMPAAIPGPGATAVVCVAPDGILTRRAIVTNSVVHPAVPELEGALSHGHSVVLNRHSGNAGELFVYDDSEERDLSVARHTDGPGSLAQFAGLEGSGQWLLTMESTNQPGSNQGLWISLDAQTDLSGGVSARILPGGSRQEFIRVPSSATNLTAMVNLTSGSGPIAFQLLPANSNPADQVSLVVPGGGSGALTVDSSSRPPVHEGTYCARLSNLGPETVELTLLSSISGDAQAVPVQSCSWRGPAAIPDDAISCFTISVTNRGYLEAAEVGVRIEHPRISDLVLTLVSPAGRRVRLQENRGGATVEGMGVDVVTTNVTTVSWSGGPEAFTNIIEMGQTAGSIRIDYDFYSLADTMHVYYENERLFDSGLVSGDGSTAFTYGPGVATTLTVVMNEGGNSDTNTAWFYMVTSTHLAPLPLTFTDDDSVTSVPIKFAPTPLTNINDSVPGSPAASGILYQPEQPLSMLVGESPYGDWRLEVKDCYPGATNPPPKLISWNLSLRVRPMLPTPVKLNSGQTAERLVAPRQVLWFAVDAPDWASYATNSLLFSSVPVALLFDTNPPAFVNPGAVPLLTGSVRGVAVLRSNSVPALLPGRRYYLGVENTNDVTASTSLRVDFDVNRVMTLQSGAPFAAEIQRYASDFYRFVVSTNAVRAQFEVNNPTANLALLVRMGLPLPGESNCDYSSSNSWVNDELVVVYDSSSPVPLSAGDWYLAVVNPLGEPATYAVKATEFASRGTNLAIIEMNLTDDRLCLTWNSLPGVHYYIQGKVSLSDPEWTTLSPTLTANDELTTFCLPVAPAYQYFRVCEGLVLLTPPLLISSVSALPSGVLLEWSAEPGAQFRVEWRPAIDSSPWFAFTNVVTMADGRFQFLDDGSQSGGLGQTRFYRLMKLP